MDLSDLIDSSAPLLLSARNRYVSQLSCHPADADILHRLGDIYRALGDLEAAAQCFERVLEIQPENSRARRTLSVLTGNAFHKSNQSESRISPFACTHHFLDESEIRQIWKVVREEQEKFRESRIYAASDSAGKRRSTVLYENHLGQFLFWFMDKVESNMKSHISQLGMCWFEASRREVQLTRHQGGEFFKMHQDVIANSPLASRKVTFVYYFHTQPKSFSGGDLVLLDELDNGPASKLRYTRICPVHNSLILFPSHCYHQVTPVISSSEEFLQGRFTLNGWWHCNKSVES
ncbi:MAG: 2OG-Fe(II) oxygenase [Xanthomonadales bacterium]|nr:2OG-Fe(II) oxygenase [Xanthomonadales bacterium]